MVCQETQTYDIMTRACMIFLIWWLTSAMIPPDVWYQRTLAHCLGISNVLRFDIKSSHPHHLATPSAFAFFPVLPVFQNNLRFYWLSLTPVPLPFFLFFLHFSSFLLSTPAPTVPHAKFNNAPSSPFPVKPTPLLYLCRFPLLQLLTFCRHCCSWSRLFPIPPPSQWNTFVLSWCVTYQPEHSRTNSLSVMTGLHSPPRLL